MVQPLVRLYNNGDVEELVIFIGLITCIVIGFTKAKIQAPLPYNSTEF